MKKLFLMVMMLVMFTTALPIMAADVEMVISDPPVMSIRQSSATGEATNIAHTMQITTINTDYIEIISVRLHLSGAGGANNFTMTQDSALGAAYDTLCYSQDMTLVTDIYYLYSPGEAIFDNNDKIIFAWTNGNQVTWGLEILYRQR